MSSSCRWSDNWKRLSRASVNLRSGLPGWSVPPRHLTIPLCRRRKGKSPLVPRATGRRGRVRRYRLQCTIQAAAAAGYCYRATTRHAEGHHVEALSRRPRSPAQPHHGSGSAGRSGTQASQAHRRKPGAPVGVHHQSGRALYQQRLRSSCPPQRDLPQGDQRIPQRVGRRDLCRIPLSR